MAREKGETGDTNCANQREFNWRKFAKFASKTESVKFAAFVAAFAWNISSVISVKKYSCQLLASSIVS
jgi:hypothetical protein